MRIFEVNDFLNRFNTFLLESFKEDMYRVYPEQKNNTNFKNAITFFNTHKQVKDGIKRMIEKDVNIESSGNLADDIKKKFNTGEEFITAVSNLLGKLNASIEKGEKKSYEWKKQIGQEYAKILQAVKNGKKPDVDDKDFWLIPCRTYEELHSVSQKYTGVLPILSRDKIESEYGLKVPEEATHYETDDTPSQFLKYMKKEKNFFMDPTWCIAKDKFHFDRYKLETPKNERAKCYVFISKKYPNVRFCVTLIKGEREETLDFENEKVTFTIDDIDLGEVRDPWQIGGEKLTKPGLSMMKSAFGRQKVDEVIKEICSPETITMSFSELKDGIGLFSGIRDVSSINTSFDSLINGRDMFQNSGFKNVNCNFPVLERALRMFRNCKSLCEFTSDLPELTNGEDMFIMCSKLKNIKSNLPKLKDAVGMFCYCKSLETFDCDLLSLNRSNNMFSNSGIKTFKSNLPELNSAGYMFRNCDNLERFDTQLPKLEDGREMFSHCKKLKSFNSELLNLKNGDAMFSRCDLMKFEIDMPELINGGGMFYENKKLKTFNCELPSLEDGGFMFFGCESLTSFKSDLSSLSDANYMFQNCENLRRFEGDLSSLKYGYKMFSGCKLDTESVKKIAETLPNNNEGCIMIGVDEMDEEKEKYIEMIKEKGWKVIVE